jgi:hypothetical protein
MDGGRRYEAIELEMDLLYDDAVSSERGLPAFLLLSAVEGRREGRRGV